MPEKANLNLVYSSPWSPKELAMTEWLNNNNPVLQRINFDREGVFVGRTWTLQMLLRLELNVAKSRPFWER